jgi:hypothetical protein
LLVAKKMKRDAFAHEERLKRERESRLKRLQGAPRNNETRRSLLVTRRRGVLRTFNV